MGKVLGIDLGTSNSVVAVFEEGQVRVLTNEDGAQLTPSVLAFGDDDVRVGRGARQMAAIDPQNVIHSVKRLVGRSLRDCQEDRRWLPYALVEGHGGEAWVEVRGKTMAPAEVLARLLVGLKKMAEKHLGEPVSEAVITVPAYFDDSQRQVIRHAGRLAGLTVMRTINEPTAAALAYGLGLKRDELIVVYHLGGGTCDVSVLEVGGDVVEVTATSGDMHLGGDDIDILVMQWLIAGFKDETGIDVSGDKTALQRLRDAAEQAKIELSFRLETTIHLPFLAADASGLKNLVKPLSRAQFEQMIGPLVERTMVPVRKALADARKKPDDVHGIVLVGGSTRIPMVQEAIKNFFGKEPYKGVNPDEVVAVGAAIQGGVCSGHIKDIILLDVAPLSLGVEVPGGAMAVVIARNRIIPTQGKKIFSTEADNQTEVTIHVLQGEHAEARHNRTLGRLSLGGLAPAPRGTPRIEVTFDISADGILSVTACDVATNRQVTLRCKGAVAPGHEQVAAGRGISLVEESPQEPS